MNIQNSLETVLIKRILIGFKAKMEKKHLRGTFKDYILKVLYFWFLYHFQKLFKCSKNALDVFICLKLKISQLLACEGCAFQISFMSRVAVLRYFLYLHSLPLESRCFPLMV